MSKFLSLVVLSLFSISSFGQTFKPDSFFNHLFLSGKTELANIYALANLDKESNTNAVYMLNYAAYTKQKKLVDKSIFNKLKTVSSNQKTYNQVITDLIFLGFYSKAYYLSSHWNYNVYYPELQLLTNRFDGFKDSSYLKNPFADSLYKRYLDQRPKRFWATTLSIIPGIGKITLGNHFDGISAMVLVSALSYQGIENNDNIKAISYTYFVAAASFYVSSIYGTQLLLNKKELNLRLELHEAIVSHIISN